MARTVGWLAGLVVLLVVVPGCASHSPNARPSPRPSSSTAVDGGGLHLVESGFQVETEPPGSAGTKRALIGVVVENTSRKQEAKAAYLTVQLFDAAGEQVFINGGSPPASGFLPVPWVQPGARVGMGLLVSNQYDTDRQRTPVRMVVTIGASD